MKLIELNQTSIEYFRDFDPFSILDRTDYEGRIALGALEEDDYGYDQPVGLAICSPASEDLRIEWLFIDPDFQSRGFGSELFYQLSAFALEQGYKTLSVYLIESGLQHTVTLGARSFFEDQGLIMEDDTPGEWTSDLKTILSQPYFTEPSLVPVQSLSSLSEKEIQDIYLEFEKNKSLDIIHSITANESIIKKDICFFCKGRQDALMGALIIGELAGQLSLLAFFAENEEIARSLWTEALHEAANLYGSNIYLHARLWRDSYVGLMNDIMPDGHYSASMLSVDLLDLVEKTSPIETSYGIMQEELPDDILVENISENAGLPFRTCKEASATLGQLAENPFFGENVEVSSFEPLSFLTLMELEEVIGWINEKVKGSAFTAIPKNSDYSWLDADLSCMIRKDGRVQSAFLIGIDEEEQLFPLALYSQNNIGLLQITEYIQHVFKSAQAKYDDDKIVCVRIYNSTVKNMCRKIFL